jgi:ElaB/YqjD/DUF883 family membrane-anchored ribosome-binding protein
LSTLTSAKEQLATDFREIMNDVESLVSSGAARADGEAEALRERIQRRLESARRRAADLQHEAAEHVRRAAGSTDDFVHDHPWQAVGVAAALGVVVGLLIGRR